MSNEMSPSRRKTWYEDVQTPDYFQEPDTVPWAATPLHPIATQQNSVHMAIEGLYAHPYPHDAPESFQELVLTDYLAGRAHRETVNASHFMKWLETHDIHDQLADRMIRNAAEPGSSPIGLLQFVCTTNIQATELAKLSVPYGYRLQYVPALRAAVDVAIREMNGEARRDTQYSRLHVTPHFDENGESSGILATYQRGVGSVSDNNGEVILIKERQVLAIRTDEHSSFPQELRDDIESIGIVRQKRALSKVAEFIQADTPEDFMVPMSMTVFAHRLKHDPPSEHKGMLENDVFSAHLAFLALNGNSPDWNK